MITIINSIIGVMLAAICLISIITALFVYGKYTKMFKTMSELGHDKQLLKIEKTYRHGILKNRLKNIDTFIDKEFYQIKLFKIPLYKMEAISIYGIYLSMLLGLTFTFINIALSSNVRITSYMEIIFLSIVAFVNAMAIILVRAFCGLNELRDYFKVKLCAYLSYELELFDEVLANEKINQKNQKVTKIHKVSKGSKVHSPNIGQFNNNVVYHFSNGRTDSEKRLEGYDSECIVSVIEEIFG